MTEKKLLKEYAPTCFITNEKYEILYTHGKTTSLLEVPAGEANWTLLRMAQPGLSLELTNALRRAVDKKELVRVPRLRINTDKGFRVIDLTVEPIFDPPAMQGLVAVIIQELSTEEDSQMPAIAVSASDENPRIADLERELKATKDYLQATIEQLESSNEELTSTNEEMQSSNEELQSTNQELQTSKEELQSMNEELATVNSELETKIEALSLLNNDLNNIMASTKIAIIFLDMKMRIQRFTPAASDIINMIDTDIGRPLEHIAHNLEYGALITDADRVLRELIEVEKEILARSGKWFLVRARPYRRGDNVIDGVVITFTDISEQKRVQEDLAKLATVADNTTNSVIITNANGIIEYVNRYFAKASGYRPEEAIGQPVSIIRSDRTEPAVFKGMWDKIKGGSVWSGVLQNKRKDGSHCWDKVTIAPILNDRGQITHFVGIQTSLDADPNGEQQP
ncbi:MAG TPA: PAS domain-containing protein [Oligoflexia bacterium]|nr:PAS domain-containing protein [Oligoflexia bacterium]